jgi:uncharacterized membrane protein
LGAVLMLAFFSFAISIREANLAGFLVHAGDHASQCDLEVETHLDKASINELNDQLSVRNINSRILLMSRATTSSIILWSYGIRFYYLAVCVTGWLINPIVCIVLTFLVLLINVYLERTHSLYHRGED